MYISSENFTAYGKFSKIQYLYKILMYQIEQLKIKLNKFYGKHKIDFHVFSTFLPIEKLLTTYLLYSVRNRE